MEERKTICPCCGDKHTCMNRTESVLDTECRVVGTEWRVDCMGCGEVFPLGTSDAAEAVRRWNSGQYEVTD